ncbi:hypothetical protein LTS17_007486 [Exophiala oligosperma]
MTDRQSPSDVLNEDAALLEQQAALIRDEADLLLTKSRLLHQEFLNLYDEAIALDRASSLSADTALGMRRVAADWENRAQLLREDARTMERASGIAVGASRGTQGSVATSQLSPLLLSEQASEIANDNPTSAATDLDTDENGVQHDTKSKSPEQEEDKSTGENEDDHLDGNGGEPALASGGMPGKDCEMESEPTT